MDKLKKIITFIIVIAFIVNSAEHGFALRPMAHKITFNKSDNIYPELNKLVEMLTSLSPQNKKQLAFEVSISADIFRGIRECFDNEWPDSATEIAIEAIKNKTPGVTSEDIRTWINQCFVHGWPNSAAEITIEAIKNKTPGITSEYVKKGIRECFDNERPDSAAKIIIEAIRNKTPKITSKDIKAWIRECLDKKRSDSAALIAIEAIKNNIPGITSDYVKKGIRECFADKQPDLVAPIAIEAIKNKTPGITSKDIKAWIRKCLDKKRSDSAAKIIIETIKNNIPGITSEYVKEGIRGCFDKEQPDSAAKIIIEAIKNKTPEIFFEDIKVWERECFDSGWTDSAAEIIIETIKNNIPGITSEYVKEGIRGCFANRWPDLSAKIALEAIKNNIPEITSEYVKEGIRGCFADKRPDLVAEIAIEAIKNKTPGITSEYVKKGIRGCFATGWPDLAAKIAIEAIKNNIPGITSEYVKKGIRGCFADKRSDLAAKIVIEAIKNKTPGITSEYVKKGIRGCFADKRPDLVAKIIIEAIRETKLRKKITQVFSMLKASGLYSKDTRIMDLQVVSYALQNDLLDDLVVTLTNLKADKQILHLIDMLILKEGEEPILNEIFIQKGLRSFVELYKSIYPHIFADLLPEDVDISDQRVNTALNSITYFEASTFSREDLTIAKIYKQYHDNYKAGRIKPLPEGLPPMRTIEVSTRKLQSLTDDAKVYYARMMYPVRDALSAIDRSAKSSVAVYQDISVELLEAVEKRISSLNQAKAKKGFSAAAIDHTDKQIHILKEAAVIISGSIKEGAPCLISFRQEHIRAISRIKSASHILQVFLFILAFQENPTWKNHFKRPENQYPSKINITQFVDFVDSFIKPHLLDAMQQKARVLLLKHANSRIFKQEINRLSQKKGTFKRRVRIYPTRGWIAEFIGYYSNECWTQTGNIIRDNPDTIALVFIDGETGDILGGTLLMPNSVDGKGVLIDRGLSPRTTVTSQLNTEDFVTKVADYEEEIARSLGKEMIIVPSRGLEAGLGTNNPDIIEYYKRTLSSRQPVDLDRDNNFNNHDITTGRCVILREFSLEEGSLTDQAFMPEPLAVKDAFMALERAILSSA